MGFWSENCSTSSQDRHWMEFWESNYPFTRHRTANCVHRRQHPFDYSTLNDPYLLFWVHIPSTRRKNTLQVNKTDLCGSSLCFSVVRTWDLEFGRDGGRKDWRLVRASFFVDCLSREPMRLSGCEEEDVGRNWGTGRNRNNVNCYVFVCKNSVLDI